MNVLQLRMDTVLLCIFMSNRMDLYIGQKQNFTGINFGIKRVHDACGKLSSSNGTDIDLRMTETWKLGLSQWSIINDHTHSLDFGSYA